MIAQPAAYYSQDYLKEGIERYSQGVYHEGNLQFARMIRKCSPRRVFEFCAAEGDLAEILLATCPSIEFYKLTDFCPEAITFAAQRLHMWPQASVELLDIDRELNRVNWEAIDTFVSTASEHVMHDVEAIRHVPTGCTVALRVLNMLWTSHVRAFGSYADILARYGALLTFRELRVQPLTPDGRIRKYMFTAIKK